MITNFLLDNAALVPVALVLVALACVLLGYLARHRAVVLWILAGLSLVPVVALTLIPESRRLDQVCAVQFSWPTLGSVELLANVALFIPPAYFTALVARRPGRVLAAGIGLSAAIEAVQALIPAIGRSCDTNDWAMNSFGVIIGVVLAVLTYRLTRKRANEDAD